MLRRFNRFSMIEHTLFSHPFKNSKVDKKSLRVTQLINASCQIYLFFLGGGGEWIYFIFHIQDIGVFFFFWRSFLFSFGNNTRVRLAET